MPTRKRRQNGGGGNSYSFGAAVSPGTPYASEVVGGASCMAANRPGMVAGYSPPGLGGLPGMAGGSRKVRRGSKRRGSKRRGSKRRQRGGRYMVAAAPYPESSSVGPNVYAPVSKLGCNFQGGGGADTVAYYAPTAGYSQQPSSWVGATGSPVLLQAPYAAGAMNQACLKTGGGRRRRRGRKSRRH
jgi:hypothetical protein